MCRSSNGTTPADPHVAREIPKDDDGGDVDPTMPSFNLGINQDEIDVSGRLSPETIDVNGSPLVPIRVIIPPDFNEVERERVYRWVMDDKEPKNVIIDWYKESPGMEIRRDELWSLKGREWINSRVIEFMCFMLNDLPCKRFEKEIYYVNPMILGRIMTPTNVEKFENKDNPVYVGVKECWPPEVILFNKQHAARTHTFFFPICLEHHRWMYAFHPESQSLWALDSIFRLPLTEHRKNVDRYVARIIEELVNLLCRGIKPSNMT
ncbi:hypothetical protein PIB30_029758 [Stylosanthes scabra]|uniref:Uncharacterized protein n=1 Tax=Stylosanthes scabra TaxID=79078 RepID=A0ABU6QB16_9FABA|nr:hypothetical protein [Stylosanthes scabra]